MEYWDLYNYEGKKKEKIAIRGNNLEADEYHLVVNAWIVNNKNEFLITQRAKHRSHPLMWECTGGSALLGEKSIDAAIREVKEELGINVKKENAIYIGCSRRYYDNCPDILEVWLFHQDVSIDDVVIQKDEVNDVMWASKEKVLQLFNDGKFEGNSFFEEVLNYPKKESLYYVGFNACNAICNEVSLSGSLTINPNHERGNIYYTEEVVHKRDNQFLKKYQLFLKNKMNTLCKKDNNTVFLAFNKGIENLIGDYKQFNIVGEYNHELLSKLNDKKYTRELFKDIVKSIDSIWIDKKISYEKMQELIGTNSFVIQGRSGSGGDNTYFIDNKEKYEKYAELNNYSFFVSRYLKHLPVNMTVIVSDYNDIIFPPSVQLIELKDDRFKYVGADFIYYNSLDKSLKEKLLNYTKEIVQLLKKKKYRGILGIDFIIDDYDNIYFMEINPRFQASSFIINKKLSKYCNTCLAKLHYYAVSKKYIGNTYLDKIDNSFLNCYNRNDYSLLKNYHIIKNGYYKKNPKTYFRKVYNYSILKLGKFQKRTKDE